MDRIYVNFAERAGTMKPMHAVNNGPIHKFAEDQRISKLSIVKKESKDEDDDDEKHDED